MIQTVSASAIEQSIASAGLMPLAAGVAERFALFLELLQRWNARLNLTAIREPSGILDRHLVECVFCAQNLPSEIGTLLDFGSGGGFPGIPISLCRPEILVTLAESQGRKAAFLREALRVLDLRAEVYSGRVESMDPSRRFDAVAMRAVDRMGDAVAEASRRSKLLAVLTTETARPELGKGFELESRRVPGSSWGMLLLAKRV